MLGPIRKFSSSIYAKILLGIIIIPFVFWGMGGSIRGGTKNVVVVIDDDKYTIQHFSNFIKNNADKKVDANEVEKFLSTFIGQKLLEKEIENLGITISDKSLSRLIKHQKGFKKNDVFSRTAYEKFLLENNITATDFEHLFLKEEKKKQLLEFIGGGISPSNFLADMVYDKINQKRSIELIKLNDALKKNSNFTENEIKNYFRDNKNKYVEIFKSFKVIELTPKKLIGSNEFSNLFFKKIDEIDDSIMEGTNFDYLIQKFNLENPKMLVLNKLGQDKNFKINNAIKKSLIKKVFALTETETSILFEEDNKYFIVGLYKTETIERNIDDGSVRKKITNELLKKSIRSSTVEIIDKINKNKFHKNEFSKFAESKKVNIQKIQIDSLNDSKLLKKEVVAQIYKYPENRVIVVNDIFFNENYLIYIDKIKKAKIDVNSEEFEKYLGLSRIKLVSDLYNTYDNYLNKRYKIDINYQALDTVKNYFN